MLQCVKVICCAAPKNFRHLNQAPAGVGIKLFSSIATRAKLRKNKAVADSVCDKP